jgi:hypothetical protein
LLYHSQTKPRRGGGLKQINICRKVPLQSYLSTSVLFLHYRPDYTTDSGSESDSSPPPAPPPSSAPPRGLVTPPPGTHLNPILTPGNNILNTVLANLGFRVVGVLRPKIIWRVRTVYFCSIVDLLKPLQKKFGSSV